MDRRTFILSAGAAALLPHQGLASSNVYPNGERNTAARTFDWTNGGGDPLRPALRADGFRLALDLPQLRITPDTRAGLRRVLLQSPSSHVDLRIYEGDVVGDLMISGDGWIAQRPRVVTARWRNRNTGASWWAWTNTVTGERWEIIVPHVCSNLIMTRLGAAVPCVCDPYRDACF